MVVAGNYKDYTTADGNGAHAVFLSPGNIAFDQAGNLYVADVSRLRKISPTGQVTTIAGQAVESGMINAVGPEARFDRPQAIAGDGHGNVYVIDGGNNLLRKIDAAGLVTTVTGFEGTAPRNPENTLAPIGTISNDEIAADADGNVYVADKGMNRIRKITPAGKVSTLRNAVGATVDINGADLKSRFGEMTCMISDKAGNLYFLYHHSDKNAIRKIDINGTATTIAVLADEKTDFAKIEWRGMLFYSHAITVDNEGSVYLLDDNGLRKIDASGVVSKVDDDHSYRVHRINGRGNDSNMTFAPNSMVVDNQGNMYWAVNSMVRKMTPDGVTSTIAGEAGRSEIRLGSNALLDAPSALVLLDAETLGLISRNAVLKLTLP
jgi:hypothetical protein